LYTIISGMFSLPSVWHSKYCTYWKKYSCDPLFWKFSRFFSHFEKRLLRAFFESRVMFFFSKVKSKHLSLTPCLSCTCTSWTSKFSSPFLTNTNPTLSPPSLSDVITEVERLLEHWKLVTFGSPTYTVRTFLLTMIGQLPYIVHC
jgi:hypothetical protein